MNKEEKSEGLTFSSDEEREFSKLTTLHPRGFGQRLGVIADRIANNIWMFFILLLFSTVSYIFLQPILNQMLFISNTYQLVVLPVLGIATGLSTVVILRFLYRILLELRAEFKETRSIHRKVREDIKEIKEVREDVKELKDDVKEIKAMYKELADFIHEIDER